MEYNPTYVKAIVNKIRDDLIAIDPADTAAFDQSAQAYLTTGLSQYNALIADINDKYSGTPVGATESIFAYMSPALGLDLITPPSYMSAVSRVLIYRQPMKRHSNSKLRKNRLRFSFTTARIRHRMSRRYWTRRKLKEYPSHQSPKRWYRQRRTCRTGNAQNYRE